MELAPEAYAFLASCARGETLAHAAAAALHANAQADLEHLMSRLLRAGAFADASQASLNRHAPMSQITV